MHCYSVFHLYLSSMASCSQLALMITPLAISLNSMALCSLEAVLSQLISQLMIKSSSPHGYGMLHDFDCFGKGQLTFIIHQVSYNSYSQWLELNHSRNDVFAKDSYPSLLFQVNSYQGSVFDYVLRQLLNFRLGQYEAVKQMLALSVNTLASLFHETQFSYYSKYWPHWQTC